MNKIKNKLTSIIITLLESTLEEMPGHEADKVAGDNQSDGFESQN